VPVFARAFRPRRTRRAPALIAAVAFTLAGCRNAPAAFGSGRASAAANANDFFAAAARRFTDVRRDSKFAAARPKLGRYALTPSKIFGDSAVWSVRGASDRTLFLGAGYANGHYTMGAVSALPALARPADARHTIRLHRLSEDDDVFMWVTNVDFAIGRIRAAEAAEVVGSLMRAAEGRSAAALRADYRSAFPRGSAALGRLFTIDTISTAPDAAGATTVALSISLHPERLRAASFPAFASYVDKYVAPSRYRLTVTDRAGTRYFTTAASKNRLTLRARVKDGRLVSFDGPPRPMPDALLLHSEAYAKFGIFTVGASELVSELTIVRAANERGWFLRFNKEPDWHLPLAAATLLKSPLRRPFAQGGMTLRLTVRDSPDAQTVIARHTQTAVQESAVLRFLGALGSTALNDFAGKSEQEENRFWAEAFEGMRADAAALATLIPAN
jgi:predicted small secreted protein